MKTLEREFFLGFVRIHVLHHAANGRVYGRELREELARHGYDISYGTLYPMLHRMEANGLLGSTRENVGGKLRNYYTITSGGRTILRRAKRFIGELIDEVMGDA